MDNIVFDTEGDGFYFETTKLWTIHASNMTTRKKMVVHPFEDSEAKERFLNFIFKNGKPRIIGHNILGHDMLVLRKLLGIDFSVGKDTIDGRDVEFVDTFFLSMFLNPDRAGHSIGYFGEELGLSKIDYRQALIDIGAMTKEHPKGYEFSFYHELVDEYCPRDVEVTWKVFTTLMNEWRDIYSRDFNNPDYYRCGQKTFFLMACQELTGWKFDIERAKSLHSEISGMMENIRAEVEPQLPPRPLKKSEESQYRMPAKPYKGDGTFSSTMLKFIEKHGAEVLGEGKIKCYGKEYDIISHGMLDVTKPMEMANQDQLKDYFLSLGWKPSFYNFKRDEFNKPYRDPITKKVVFTTPKIQEQGNICPNLLSMETGIVRQIVKWLSLRNRQSILEGWMENPRLLVDGRLGGGGRGLAASFRQKHSTIVNVPKAQDGVLLGKEFRELFTSEDGMLIAAGDASALEARVQGHYTVRFDGGETARELLESDVHSKTAKALFPDKLGGVDIYSPDFNKEEPEFKQCRDKAKTVFYACLPMDTKVLTKSGWKYYDEIQEGDIILSFNQETGVVEEDTVLRKHFFKDKEVVEYSNKWDSFRCTKDHRWYGWRRTGNKEKVFGFFEANQFTQEHNIILTAPWVGDETSQISNDTCALLGWLAKEGSWCWSKKSETTSSSNGKKKGIHCSISQSKNKFWREIEDILNRLGIEYHKNVKKQDNGNDVNHYTLKPRFIRPFLDQIFEKRVDKHDVDWVSLILRMNRNNLESFYNAFYKGDGQFSRNNCEVMSQNLGNIFDGVVTAAQLLGKGRVTFGQIASASSPMKSIRVQKRKHITCQEISQKNLGVQDTFCLTTINGSFIVWQGDFIGITGNCLYGAGDAKLARIVGLPESEGKVVAERFWSANKATKDLRDSVEAYWEVHGKKFLPAVDGRKLITRKKNALLNVLFQSCGAIAMDYAGCYMDSWLGGIKWDEDNKPYYSYKGYIVRRVIYMHDEYQYECSEEIAEEVSRMIEKAIEKAGETLKLKIPLAGEGKVGKNWKETH